MIYKKRFLILFIVIFTLGIASLNGFGFLWFSSTEKWKEEVKLSDGRIIIIERERVLESGGDEWASNRRGLKPKEHHIRFKLDELGKTIEYRTLKKSDGLYPEIPLILDLENGQPIIFTIVGIGTRCEAYNKYIYRNGVWKEEKLPEKFEPRTTNLLVRGSDSAPRFVNLETKRKENADSRKPVRQVGPTREIRS
jgi:hypothetical protein